MSPKPRASRRAFPYLMNRPLIGTDYIAEYNFDDMVANCYPYFQKDIPSLPHLDPVIRRALYCFDIRIWSCLCEQAAFFIHLLVLYKLSGSFRLSGVVLSQRRSSISAQESLLPVSRSDIFVRKVIIARRARARCGRIVE